MKIILIAGLGYDHRIFERLKFKDFELIHLNWIEPRQHEKINDYARRMAEELPKTEEKLILMGHSFGGIMAQEIAKFRPVEKIFLFSSIRSRTEMPWFFKILPKLHIHRLFYPHLTIKTIPLWGKFHDFKTKKEQALFKSMVSQYSDHYLQWALKTLCNWQHENPAKELEIVQFHGTKDKTFPIKLLQQVDYPIEQGSHLMIYTQVEKVQPLLQKELEKYKSKNNHLKTTT